MAYQRLGFLILWALFTAECGWATDRNLACPLIFPQEPFAKSQVYIFKPRLEFRQAEIQLAIEHLTNQEGKAGLNTSDRETFRSHYYMDVFGVELSTVRSPTFYLVHPDFRLYSQLPRSAVEYFVEPSFIEKTWALINQIKMEIETLKRRKISHIWFEIRATSNLLGHSIRKGFLGDKEGLHSHALSEVNRMDFVMPVLGPGMVYKQGGRLMTGRPHEFIVFDPMLPHGSPDSEAVRLILVGTYYFAPFAHQDL